MLLQYVQHHQTICKYLNEIIYVFIFVFVIIVNKYVLSELKFAVPTVFQGWQTLSCVILLSVFSKLNKIKTDLQILDTRALSLLSPALICFAVGIVAGSKALAELDVPIFLAVTNLYPAILSLLNTEKNVNHVSLRICGSTAILGTIIVIIIYTTTLETASPLLWLLGHIFLNLMYYLYLNKLNLDLTNTTQIYYRNFFSIIFLFPISLYLDVLHLPANRGWEFYLGCFISGVLGTLLQVWTFKVSQKLNYLKFEGLAKVLCTIIAYKIFVTEIQSFIWVLIIVNFLISAIFLRKTEKNTCNVKSEINLAIPPPYVKIIDEDMMSLV